MVCRSISEQWCEQSCQIVEVVLERMRILLVLCLLLLRHLLLLLLLVAGQVVDFDFVLE